jgi:phosphoglycolate phosphatase-like HAD superfamily hydrolase
MTSAVSMPPVVLFDVDGTLIDSGGAGARSWTHAFDKLYGIPADIGSHTAAGETDPVVARKTFEAAVGREPTEAELARLFAVYLLRLSEEGGRPRAIGCWRASRTCCSSCPTPGRCSGWCRERWRAPLV